MKPRFIPLLFVCVLSMVYGVIIFIRSEWFAAMAQITRRVVAETKRYSSTKPETAYPKKAPVRRSGLPRWIEPFRKAAEKPEWCNYLEKNPRPRPKFPLTGECGRKKDKVICSDGLPMFFGWKNEDLYTWWYHFRHLRRRGVFVDIAANNPISCSNTYFYEHCLGWKGVCVEASPEYFPKLRKLRRCALVKACVSNKREKVTFIDSDQLGGIKDTNKNINNKKLHKTRRQIECVKTSEALGPLKVKHIDFMSLDVEGHELFVLQGIDWKRTKISVLTVESNKKEVRRFLETRGFRLHKVNRKKKEFAMRGDWLFVHKSVRWGHPK